MNNQFTVIIDGLRYENFKSARIFKSLDNGCSEFFFVFSNSLNLKLPFGKGSKVEIWIGDFKKLTGYINMVGGTYDATNHELYMQGRCKTQDLIDSSLKEVINIKDEISLKNIVRKVLKVQGLDLNVVLDPSVEASGIKMFSKNELVSSEVDENAFDFIEKYCRKRQVLFTTNEDGDVYLTRAGTERYTTILQSVVEAKQNNILSASLQDSDQERFNTYIVFSQNNLLSGINDTTPEIKKSKPAIDSNIRASRIIRINSSLSNDIQTSTDRAIWESNIRRVKAFQYNCRIRGHYLDEAMSELVDVNKIIHVNDELLGINSDLLIKSCGYYETLENGNYTDLELVNKDAYTLQAEQDEVESRFNKKNAILPIGD